MLVSNDNCSLPPLPKKKGEKGQMKKINEKSTTLTTMWAASIHGRIFIFINLWFTFVFTDWESHLNVSFFYSYVPLVSHACKRWFYKLFCQPQSDKLSLLSNWELQSWCLGSAARSTPWSPPLAECVAHVVIEHNPAFTFAASDFINVSHLLFITQ